MYDLFENLNSRRKTYEKKRSVNNSMKSFQAQGQFSNFILTGKTPKKKPQETRTVIIRKTIIVKR
jgi:hypothetical protein